VGHSLRDILREPSLRSQQVFICRFTRVICTALTYHINWKFFFVLIFAVLFWLKWTRNKIRIFKSEILTWIWTHRVWAPINLLSYVYGHLSLTVWPQHAIYCCFQKRMTLNHGFQCQYMWNVKTDLSSQHMVSYLLPIQTMVPSVTVFEILSVFICMGNPIPIPSLSGF